MATERRAPASITLRRRIAWMDTDAAGIYHYTVAFRLAEEAEAALHTALGIVDATFGTTPRVNVNFDFRRSLRFNDEVDVRLTVASVGRTSAVNRIEIEGPDGLAVEGTITIVHLDKDTWRPVPWPDAVAAALGAGGTHAA